MKWKDTNLVLMEVMTILISMMTTTIMLKASLGRSLSYFVSYFYFWMFGTVEYSYGHDEFLEIV